MTEPVGDDLEPSFVVFEPASDNDPRGRVIMRFKYAADALAFADSATAPCAISYQGRVYSVSGFKALLDSGEIA